MNKAKSYLLSKKLKFLQSNAPTNFDHWNEDSKSFNFYQTHSFDENVKPIIIKKPIWLRMIEFLAYKVF